MGIDVRIVEGVAGRRDATAVACGDDAPWGALRALASALGVEDAARAHPLLGAAFGEPSASTERRLHGGLGQARLPNVLARMRPINRAWSALLGEALRRRRATLVVPELDLVDLTSLRAIRPILARLPDPAQLTVVIGKGTARTPPAGAAIDAWFRTAKERELARLELIGTGLEDAAGEATPVHATRPEAPASPPLTLAALRSALDALAFDAAVRLAVGLSTSPLWRDLTAAERREVHAAAAIAALNLEPLARGAHVAVRLQEEHVEAALDGETEPLQRAHLLHRLSLVHARAKGDATRGLALSDQALETLRQGSPATSSSLSDYVAAWAHNGRAYALLRLGRAAEAAASCEAGLAALDRAAAGDAPAVEVGIARVLLANNRARIAQQVGDLDAQRRFGELTKTATDAIEEEHRPAHTWAPPPEDALHLAEARAYFRGQLSDAKKNLDPDVEAIASHGMGVVDYRLGEAASAGAHFAVALRLWRALDGDAQDLFTEQLNVAVSAYRAGAFDEAERAFAELRGSPLADDEAIQAETLGGLAMVAAGRGDAALARSRATEAIAQAEAVGDPAVLARTLRSAGEALLGLGATLEARVPLARATALIDGEPDAFAPDDVVGILAARLDAGPWDEALARRALALAPEALSDVNLWWDLPRLVGHLARVPDADGAEAVRRASAQRTARTGSDPL